MKLYLARTFQPALLLLALLGSGPIAFANTQLNQPPKQVIENIEKARPMGFGTLRWFGLRVYDGQLWSNTEPEEFNYKRDPSWLELKYARDFKGTDIAKRSIDEIQSIGVGTSEQRQVWLTKLIQIFPDVKKGQSLSALFSPGKGLQFFHNDSPLNKLDDPALAEAFMGIWLDPKTSAPEMRRELIGLKR